MKPITKHADLVRCVEELEADRALLLAACKQFVRYATSGKHPYWGRYLNTRAGANLLAAIRQAEGE